MWIKFKTNLINLDRVSNISKITHYILFYSESDEIIFEIKFSKEEHKERDEIFERIETIISNREEGLWDLLE